MTISLGTAVNEVLIFFSVVCVKYTAFQKSSSAASFTTWFILKHPVITQAHNEDVACIQTPFSLFEPVICISLTFDVGGPE